MQEVSTDEVWFQIKIDHTLTAFQGSFDQLVSQCKLLLQSAEETYLQKEKATPRGKQDIQYEQKIAETGTIKDKLNLISHRIRRCPLVYIPQIFTLLQMMFQHKRNVPLAVDILFEVLELIIPQNRCLVPLKLRFQVLQNNEMQIYKSPQSLLIAYVEDLVVQFVQQLSKLLVSHLLSDKVLHMRKIGLDILNELANYQTTDKMAIKSIIQKFKDPYKEIQQQVSKILGGIIQRNTFQLVNIVVEIISQIQLISIEIYKPLSSNLFLSIQQRSHLEGNKHHLKLLLVFVKSYLIEKQLSSKVFADLADLYFGLIQQQLSIKDDFALVQDKKQQDIKIDRVKAEEFKFLKIYISSLADILPKADFNNVPNLERHLQQISLLSKHVNFNISVQINELLLKLLNSINSSQNQKLSAELVKNIANIVLESLYYSCFRYDFQYTSEESGFFTYLFNVQNLHTIITNNILFQKEIFASFWKKLLSVGLHCFNPQFMANVLICLQQSSIQNFRVISKLSNAKQQVDPLLALPFTSPFQHDPAQKRFQIFSMKPKETLASQDQLYEFLLLKRSYHPAHKKFAACLTGNKFVPLVDLSEICVRSEHKVPRQPFSFNSISSFLKGDHSQFVHQNDIYFNQVHFNALMNVLMQQSRKEKTKAKGGSIDNIVIQDMIKQGILDQNAPFNEMHQSTEGQFEDESSENEDFMPLEHYQQQVAENSKQLNFIKQKKTKK